MRGKKAKELRRETTTLQQRIHELERELATYNEGRSMFGKLPHSPMTEKFLRHIANIERPRVRTVNEQLREHGFAPRPPAEIPDAEIAGALEHALAILIRCGFVFENTDYLNDRDLYCWIWDEILESEDNIDLEEGGFTVVSPIEGSDDEELAIRLRYFADDDERRMYAEDGVDVPPHEDPPHDRTALYERLESEFAPS